MDGDDDDRRAQINASNREKYREKWYEYNLRSRYFDECSTPGDISKLPRLKRPRRYIHTASKGDGESSCSNARGTPHKETVPGRPARQLRTTTQPAPNDKDDGSEEQYMYRYGSGELQIQDSREIYMHLLLETNSISPCDEHFSRFLLNEYSNESHSILNGKYVMVSRRSMCFRGTWKWAYYCSCDAARSQVLQAASVHVQQESEETLVEELPRCIHIDCLASILYEIDDNIGIAAHHQSQDHSYAHVPWLEEDLEIPSNINDIWPVSGNPTAAVLVSDTSFAVVDIVGGELKCLACRRDSCQHMVKITRILEDGSDLPVFLADMSSFLQSTTNSARRKGGIGSVSSQKPIPIKLDAQLQEVLAKPVIQRATYVNDSLQLSPTADGRCGKCDFLWSPDTFHKGDYPVFTLQGIYQASVFFMKCSNTMCEAVLLYDGLSDCLLNMTSYLIDHCVLRQYMHQFLHGRSPMFAFYNVWVQMQNDTGNDAFTSQLHYNKFVSGWYAFLHLLDINYQEQFLCRESSCGQHPEILICDATHLSIRKDLSLWKENLPKSVKEMQQPSTRKSIFLADTQTRKLLKRFCKSSQTRPFPADDYSALLDGCRQHQNSLVPLLTQFSLDGHASSPPAAYKPLLQALSATSPVCGVIHPEADLLELLERMARGVGPTNDLNAMAILTLKCPLVADFLQSEQFLPEVLSPILHEMLRLAVAPFDEQSSSSQMPTTVHDELSDNNPSSDTFDGMSYWPHFLKQRSRPNYAVDCVKNTRANCRKDSKNYGTMTPGVFAAYCPHGICYGFEMMNQFESPNVPFTLFLTRFVTPPQIIVYDNACHLHSYCLNREPAFFKNTKFLIDRLHWPNHTACSKGYKLDGYPRYRGINSQVAEQMNSSLQRIRVQLSYMSQNNFMWHCRFFLWGKNKKKDGGG